MKLVFGHDAAVATWVEARFGGGKSPWFRAVGIVADGGGPLLGGATFHDWNGANIELGFYGPKAVTPAVVRGLARFCFVELGVCRVSARLARGNKRVQRSLRKLGFQFEGITPRFFGPKKADDAVNFGLLADHAARLVGAA